MTCARWFLFRTHGAGRARYGQLPHEQAQEGHASFLFSLNWSLGFAIFQVMLCYNRQPQLVWFDDVPCLCTRKQALNGRAALKQTSLNKKTTSRQRFLFYEDGKISF